MSDENGTSEDGQHRDARALIASELDWLLTPEEIRLLLKEILKIDKSAKGWCKTCGGNVFVTVSDAKAVASAIGDLMTQSKGRPTEQKVEHSLTVNRRVVLADEETERLSGLMNELLQALEDLGAEKARLDGWRAEMKG